MSTEITTHDNRKEVARLGLLAPKVIAGSDGRTRYHLVEYLTAHLRNQNTRRAYARRLKDFFQWCDAREISELSEISSVQVAAYIEEISEEYAVSTVKQALAAIREAFDHLARSASPLSHNPAEAVRGPKLARREGKTPALTAGQVCDLFDAIESEWAESGSIIALRDRALIGTMLYTFARVSAALSLDVGDYVPAGKRSMALRLREKGGTPHTVPAHITLQRYLDAYLGEAGLWEEKEGPLFRTVGRSGALTENRLRRRSSLAMLKRRAADAGLPSEFSHHWLRATGITEFLEQDGTLEDAQRIAGHADTRTTKLYDRRGRKIKQEEIQRLRFERETGHSGNE